ncbi:MAG: protein-glutamate O-methyltransferase CheR [Helicobacteraceae bacterium]|jgi:chemotaxis protein methyltransferase CheR|nr:protein-glutamate O-methyltransferase CheR [Helicobacteraceae bacterium]
MSIIGLRDISREEFKLFQDYVYKNVGIALADHKITLVQGRLAKRLRALGLNSYKEYYDYMIADHSGEEEYQLISAISTNVTQFFREGSQWDFLNDELPKILARKREKKLRIWSAACSSGEEPYSIAIFLHTHINDFSQWDINILASDISKRVLAKAKNGVYEEKDIQGVPRNLLNSYFAIGKNERGEKEYGVTDPIKRMITFKMFNLVYDSFHFFASNFDIIFCRNVMIYFDAQTQHRLISSYHKVLNENGLLFVGHSESLTRNKEEFKLIKPSIYIKI